MATVSVELFIHATIGYAGETKYTAATSDMSIHDFFGPVIDRRVVELEVGDVGHNELVAAQVQTLKKQKDELLLDAQIKANQLQDKIDSLLCLEYKEPNHA